MHLLERILAQRERLLNQHHRPAAVVLGAEEQAELRRLAGLDLDAALTPGRIYGLDIELDQRPAFLEVRHLADAGVSP